MIPDRDRVYPFAKRAILVREGAVARAEAGAMTEGWNRGFETGIPFIDEQHRRQFDLVSRFGIAPPAGEPVTDPRAALAELRALTLEHFRDEETLIPELDPKGAADHIACHRRFVRLLDEIIEEFERPASLFPPMIAAMKARSLLRSWFEDHLRRHDARLRGLIAGVPSRIEVSDPARAER